VRAEVRPRVGIAGEQHHAAARNFEAPSSVLSSDSSTT
jgi:hypothetical protein